MAITSFGLAPYCEAPICGTLAGCCICLFPCVPLHLLMQSGWSSSVMSCLLNTRSASVSDKLLYTNKFHCQCCFFKRNVETFQTCVHFVRHLTTNSSVSICSRNYFRSVGVLSAYVAFARQCMLQLRACSSTLAICSQVT